jgi:hypothetical protein
MNRGRQQAASVAWWTTYAIGLVWLLLPMLLRSPRSWAPSWMPLAGLVALAAVAVTMPVVIRRGSGRLLAAAAALHLTMVLLPPLLSDDVYRYVVDGAMTRAGLSPYGWSPDHPAVSDIAAVERARANHPHLVTVYPPAAQGLFALLAWSPKSWKLLTMAGWLAGCLLVFRMNGSGRSSALSGAWACQLALHPLALLSVSLDGHVDAWGAMPMALVFLLTRRSQSGGSAARGRTATSSPGTFGWVLTAAAVAVGAGIKWFPLALLAMLPGRNWGRTLVAAATILGAVALPFVWWTGAKTVGSLGVYEQTWGYNGGIFAAAVAGLDAWLGQSLLPAAGVEARTLVRGVQGLVLVAALVVWWWRRGLREVPDAAAMVAWLAALVWLGPTHHPWYSLWLLGPALAAGRWEFVWLSGAALLGFWGPVCQGMGLGWQDPIWLAPMALAGVVPAWRLHAAWGSPGGSRGDERQGLRDSTSGPEGAEQPEVSARARH